MILASRPLEGLTGHDAGRLLLAELYRREVGGPLPPIAIAPRGKPYFPDSPWYFSLSHTPRRVFCVLARENVAVDAEELDRPVSLKLADRVLSPMERRQLDQAPDPQRAFLTFWVLKEAAAKLSGEGLRGFPDHTAFRLDDPRVTVREGCVVAVMTEELPRKEGARHAL